jgi:hypothetical protein
VYVGSVRPTLWRNIKFMTDGGESRPGAAIDLIARSDQLIAGFEDTLSVCVRENLHAAVLALRIGNPAPRVVATIRRVLERVRPLRGRIRNPRSLRQIEELYASVEARLGIYMAPQP